jgi:hypothetical protein
METNRRSLLKGLFCFSTLPILHVLPDVVSLTPKIPLIPQKILTDAGLEEFLVKLREFGINHLEESVMEFNDPFWREMTRIKFSTWLENYIYSRTIYYAKPVCDERNNTLDIIDSGGKLIQVFIKPIISHDLYEIAIGHDPQGVGRFVSTYSL